MNTFDEDIFSELELIENEPESAGMFNVSPETDIFADLEAIEQGGEATAFDRISDLGVDLSVGTVDLGESFVGLTKMGAPITKYGFDAIGYDAEQTGKFLSDLYSDERKQEEAEVEDATGVVDTIKAYIKNPAVLAGQAVQMAPGMLGIMGAARVMLARSSAAAIKAAAVKGITDPKTLASIGRKAGEKAATITAAAAEGIQQTGSSFNQLVDSAESIGKAYTASILSGLGTAGFAFLGGKLGRKLGLGDVEAGIKGKGGVTRRIVGGGIQEGLLEEMPQSAQEQAWNNYATGRPLLEGVAKAATTGALLGTITGGGMVAGTSALDKTAAKLEDKNVFDDLEIIEKGGELKEAAPKQDAFNKIKQGYIDGSLSKKDLEDIKAGIPDTEAGESQRKQIDDILKETPEFAAEATPEQEAALKAINDVGERVFGEAHEARKIKIAPETDETKSVQNVSDSLKMSGVVFFDASETQLDGVNGFYDPITKKIYVNKNTEKPMLVVFAHESLHELRDKAPDLYKKLISTLRGKAIGLKEYTDGLNSKRKEQGLTELTDKEILSEEFVADFASQAIPTADFWNKLNAENPTTTRKLAEILINLINQLRKTFGVNAKKQFKDIDAVEALAKTYAEYAKRTSPGATEATGKEVLPTTQKTEEVAETTPQAEPVTEKTPTTAIPEIKSTLEAVEFGKKATPEEVEELKKLNEKATAEQKAKLQESSDIGTKAQFLNEAIQASEGRDFEKKQREGAEKKKIEQSPASEKVEKEPEKIIPPDTEQLIKVALDEDISYTKKVKVGKRTTSATKNAGEALSEVTEQRDILKRILGCV